MAWHSPAMFADGDAEADLLADLLANGKTSRLYRTLVYEKRMALDVSAYQHSREISSFFLRRDRRAWTSLTDIAALIDEGVQGWSTRDRRHTRWSAASRRPKRTSCIACRRSAASAASPIS
jgi:predicted Zn-dependent peptidase